MHSKRLALLQALIFAAVMLTIAMLLGTTGRKHAKTKGMQRATPAESAAPGHAEKQHVVAGRSSSEGGTDGTIDTALDRSIGRGGRNFFPDKTLELAQQLSHRQKTIKGLQAYSEVAKTLKEKILDREGTITQKTIPATVERADILERQFWSQGDFDDPAAFDSLYEARALLELCLAADPDNEPALRSLIQVVESGWPVVLLDQDGAAYDRSTDPEERKVFEWNREGITERVNLLRTLWDRHLSKGDIETVEDLAALDGIIADGPPADLITAEGNRVKEQNPDINHEGLVEAKLTFMANWQLKIANWALQGVRRKGPEWEAYAKELEDGCNNLAIRRTWTGLAARIDTKLFKNSFRYWGRDQVFNGPQQRQDALIPYQEFQKQRPK